MLQKYYDCPSLRSKLERAKNLEKSRIFAHKKQSTIKLRKLNGIGEKVNAI